MPPVWLACVVGWAALLFRKGGEEMGKRLWFRKTINLGESLVVVIPSHIAKMWHLDVGEQMVWRYENGEVTLEPSVQAVLHDRDVERYLDSLSGKESTAP
jgi:antitoxin component of MazEF toxin-antitoxin module